MLLEGVRDWRIHAATIEAVPIEDDRVSEMKNEICYQAENQRFRGPENAEKLCSGTGRVAGIGFRSDNPLGLSQKSNGN